MDFEKIMDFWPSGTVLGGPRRGPFGAQHVAVSNSGRSREVPGGYFGAILEPVGVSGGSLGGLMGAHGVFLGRFWAGYCPQAVPQRAKMIQSGTTMVQNAPR